MKGKTAKYSKMIKNVQYFQMVDPLQVLLKNDTVEKKTLRYLLMKKHISYNYHIFSNMFHELSTALFHFEWRTNWSFEPICCIFTIIRTTWNVVYNLSEKTSDLCSEGFQNMPNTCLVCKSWLYLGKNSFLKFPSWILSRFWHSYWNFCDKPLYHSIFRHCMLHRFDARMQSTKVFHTMITRFCTMI